ncbi:MAG: hypothetical protein AAF533_11790 [Acidobacteriota bacterium]
MSLEHTTCPCCGHSLQEPADSEVARGPWCPCGHLQEAANVPVEVQRRLLEEQDES